MKKQLTFKQYINRVISKEAKIKFDKSVKQWVGILHHQTGSMYAQQAKKTDIVKELKEILEEFVILYLERNKAKSIREIKTLKIQGAYR